MQTKQSKYYEDQANSLTGKDRERALRAAQNHLQGSSDSFLIDYLRIQDKIINCLEVQIKTEKDKYKIAESSV